MKTKQQLLEHLAILSELGEVKGKKGTASLIDFEQMATRKCGGHYKHSDIFNRHFIEGLYSTLDWAIKSDKQEWELRKEYKEIQKAILKEEKLTHERGRLLGQRNACAMALDWDIHP